MNLYHNFFLLVLSVFVFSCGVLNNENKKIETPTAQKNQLTNAKWILNDSDIGKGIYLSFTQDSFSGFGGCNTVGGEYRKDQYNIEFSSVISTKKYCQSSSSAEFSFLNLLERVNRYQIRGNTLSMFRDNILLLKFGLR